MEHGPTIDDTQQTVLGDRYVLGPLIGTGGVAEVFRARDLRLRRDVAVKILSGPAARDPDHRRRIEREAQALAAVSHPNVLAIHDYGEERSPSGEPVPYIVMELVDGPDLAVRLAEDGPLPPDEVSDVLSGVLAGVGAAHAIGIIHGDLKPANILLSPDGPKVGDFGVARILARETGTTAIAATPTYAAPEVLKGARPEARSDLYSAACIAFECLTGRPPYVGENVYEVASLHLGAPVPALDELRADVPAGMSEAVTNALAKDPAARPESASALASAMTGSLGRATAPSAQELVPPPVVSPPPPADDAAPMAQPMTSPADETTPVRAVPTEVLEHPGRHPRWVSGLGTGLDIVRRVPAGLAIGLVGVILLALMQGQAAATIRVPSLLGVHVDEARGLADDAGVRLAVEEVDGGGAAGTVVAQAPIAGQLVRRGTTVRLEVTRGVPQVTVPDVAGRSLEEARAALEAAGLVPGSVAFRGTGGDPNTVIETVPAAGASLDEGSTVELVAVAPPPPPEEAPSEERSSEEGPPNGDRGKGNDKDRGRDERGEDEKDD